MYTTLMQFVGHDAKQRTNLTDHGVDPDVLEWFKVGGDGYQTRMNAVLRAYRDAASA